MGAFKITIDERIFGIFPEYYRGVVIAAGVKNGSSPHELTTLVRQAETDLRQRLTLETLGNRAQVVLLEGSIPQDRDQAG